jgi:outer membrane protein assembly factor BamB
MKRGLKPLYLGLVALLVVTFSFSTQTPRPVAIKSAPVASTGAWTTYHRDNARTGFDNTLPAAVGATTGWVSPVMDNEVFASPLVYNGVVYAATLQNTVYAFNQSTGAVIWQKNVGAPQPTTGCGNVNPMGILGTPVIDTAANRLYAAAFIGGSPPVFHVFGLDLANSGNIVLNTALAPSGPLTGFDWTLQQQRGALALRNGNVYVPFGGRIGDCGNYHGWVVAVPTSGAAITSVYQTTGIGAGIWAGGGVVVDETTNKIFVALGNSMSGCAANPDGTPVVEGDEVVRLSATLVREDRFIPQDWASPYCAFDEDLGSASPLLISPSLMFQAGKAGGGFLLNPNALGGMDGQLFPTPKPAAYVQADVCRGNHGNATFGSFAYAAPFIYLECDGGRGLVGLNTNTGAPSFSVCDATCGAPTWTAGNGITFGPPIVAGGVVWAATAGGGLYGYNATTGAQVFHSANFSINRFVSPAEAGGSIYVPSHTVVRSFDMSFGCTGTALSTTYLNWYDNASPGMIQDNIHILNPSGTTASSGCVTVTGYPGVAWSAAAGQETYVSMPAGTIGGPVLITVNAGPAVKSSQRVQFNQSFNEVWAASAAQAGTTSYLNWYDKASLGMLNDNIHLLNPGTASASVTVALPGATSQTATVAPGAETYVNFPQGTIGGPVKVTSTQPVLASQRVQYNQTFNEVWAASATLAATTSYLTWYDKASPGMYNDNVHLLNPGTTSASVTVNVPGATPQIVTVAGGAETYVNFPGAIGGPVTVTSTVAVLSSQRVQFNQSFNEVWSASAAQASTASYFNWYDKASGGMNNDNIHLFNPGTASATVTIALPGATSKVVTVGPGAQTYVNFPGSLGGPVSVTSTLAVLASQRVQYYQTFNEIWAG